MGFIQWITSWTILLASLFGLSRFDAGKRFLYYILWLAIVFLLVTHYQEIASLLTTQMFAGQYSTSTTVPTLPPGG